MNFFHLLSKVEGTFTCVSIIVASAEFEVIFRLCAITFVSSDVLTVLSFISAETLLFERFIKATTDTAELPCVSSEVPSSFNPAIALIATSTELSERLLANNVRLSEFIVEAIIEASVSVFTVLFTSMPK